MTELISGFFAVTPSAPPDPLFALIVGIVCVSLASALFWPRYGFVSLWKRTRIQSLRVRCEDALKHIEKACLDGRRPTIQSLGGAIQINLNKVVAANIFVAPLSPDDQEALDSTARLSLLAPGQSATVRGIALRCRGAERRRLVGLGILPGTFITAEVVSPSGDPTAYRVRGALIALRSEQADLIETVPLNEASKV